MGFSHITRPALGRICFALGKCTPFCPTLWFLLLVYFLPPLIRIIFFTGPPFGPTRSYQAALPGPSMHPGASVWPQVSNLAFPAPLQQSTLPTPARFHLILTLIMPPHRVHLTVISCSPRITEHRPSAVFRSHQVPARSTNGALSTRLAHLVQPGKSFFHLLFTA